VPALVLTARWDVIAWNRLATQVFRHYEQLPPDQRNLLRILLIEDKGYQSDAAAYEALLLTRTRTGPVAGPDSAWLLLRSLKTLELRVTRQSQSAHELARRLEAHPRVHTVRYPGLGPDPLAERYLRGGFGGLLSFDVSDEDAARRVETSTKLIGNATSLGGVDSTIEGRFRWEGERVPPGLLRLSVGLENVDALWGDLQQALEQA